MRRIILACIAALCCGHAAATLLHYEFVLTRPVQRGAEFIGGAATPIEFDFWIDSEKPSTEPGNGFYGAPCYTGSKAVLRVGSEATTFDCGPSIRVERDGDDSIFGVSAMISHGADLIAGRNLFWPTFTFWNLFDTNGDMLSDLSLPTDDAFALHAMEGYMALIFHALPGDPGYPQEEYIKFDTFFSQGDFSLTITAVPEPATLALLGFGLVGVVVARRRG